MTITLSTTSVPYKVQPPTAKPRTSNYKNYAQKIAWIVFIPFNPLISLFTQSISDMLCLETLSHGTSLWNYLNIRTEGAHPQYGGKVGGSSYTADNLGSNKGTNSLQSYSANWFHIFKDSGMIQFGCSTSSIDSNGIKTEEPRTVSKIDTFDYLLVSRCAIPLLIRMHAVLSGYNSPLAAQEFSIAGALISVITPTINFRFVPEDIDLTRYDGVNTLFDSELRNYCGRFHEDDNYGGIAWRTHEKIGIEHIGLYGIISQGFKGDLKERIRQNPIKFLYGTTRLVVLISITAIIFRKIASCSR